MAQYHTEAPPALLAFELTYSPGYRPSGSPIHPQASRQVLRERRTVQLQALTAEGATDNFERATGFMVTACTRLQSADLTELAGEYPRHPDRVEADWYGGGFGYTKHFPRAADARRWGEAKAKAHVDAVICVTPRSPLAGEVAA
jgi:hypothetical protein